TTVPLPESSVTGFLNISSRPIGLELSIDGQARGTTPARALQLPVGPHTIMVTNPSTGQSWTRQVEVQEGRSQLIRLGGGT
ncbi:MAG: PEGA domain-containing protein, partial [Oligoflexia bacterium]|nr:PEGA domain-containing protein [Oligoflexia bacterium]